MANYGIEKVEKAAKTLIGVCGSLLAVIIGGLAVLFKSISGGKSISDDDSKETDTNVEQQPKGKKGK